MIRMYKTETLLLALFLSLNSISFAQKDTLSFLHISDLHVIFNQQGYPPAMIEYRKLKQYDQGENRLRNFLLTVPEKTGCNMVIATGDLVDFIEEETSDDKILNIQIPLFSGLLDDYPVPVFLTLGNHDLFSFKWQNDKLTHHQNHSGEARAAWIRNFSCFKNGTFYSKVLKVGTTDYRLIFLDNAFYQFHPDDDEYVPYIDKSQEYWLNDQLNQSSDDVEIILMHIPFTGLPETEKNSGGLYPVLAANPSVRLILSGHHHKNSVEPIPTAGEKGIIQVKTGSLVQDTESWRMVRLTEENIIVSSPGSSDFETVIPVK